MRRLQFTEILVGSGKEVVLDIELNETLCIA
jgi:hypothetical protein